MRAKHRHKQVLTEHLHTILAEKPACLVCGQQTVEVDGEFSLIGTDPRMPRIARALKCHTCGFLMLFELPSTP